MANEQVLDLLRVDVDPAGDDHEALAVGEEQIAVLVDPADVAQGRPTVLVSALGGLVRSVVIFEGPAAGEIDDAFGARGKFVAGLVADLQLRHQGAADRALLRQPFLGVDGGKAVALGAGVVFVDDRSPPVDHRLLDRHRTGGGGVKDALQRRDVVLGADFGRQLEHAHEVRWHPLGAGDLVFLDVGQSQLGVEPLHQDHRAAEPGQAQPGPRRLVLARHAENTPRGACTGICGSSATACSSRGRSPRGCRRSRGATTSPPTPRITRSTISTLTARYLRGATARARCGSGTAAPTNA